MNESSEDKLHRQAAAAHLSNEGRKYFDLIEFDANEELVSEIRKHPFGLLLIFGTGAFVALTLMAVAVVVASIDFAGLLGAGVGSAFRPVALFASLLLLLGAAIITSIAAFLYRSNVIFVTSEKIAQVVYVSLFNRKISQLSIGDVQDVTVSQKGIFAHLFKYGTLVVETAGEQQNYTFSYVPDPYQNSKIIVGAHERNLVEHGN